MKENFGGAAALSMAMSHRELRAYRKAEEEEAREAAESLEPTLLDLEKILQSSNSPL